MIYKRSN